MPPTRTPARRTAALLGAILIAGFAARPALADPMSSDTATSEEIAAPERPEYARTGLYGQFGVVIGSPSYGWMQTLDAWTAASGAAALSMPGPVTADVGVSSSNFLGFDLGVGYRLTRRIAVDATFEWAQADLWADVVQRTTTQRLRTQQPRGPLETWITSVNGRFYLTTGRLQPFAMAGLGAMKATPIDPATGLRRDAHGFASRFGGGLDFYVTRYAVATADISYVLATGDTGDSDLLSFRASLAFRR